LRLWADRPRRRHKPRKPPIANTRPGSAEPATGPGTEATPSLKVTVPPGSQFHDPPSEKTVEVATIASVKSLPTIGAKEKVKSKANTPVPPKKPVFAAVLRKSKLPTTFPLIRTSKVLSTPGAVKFVMENCHSELFADDKPVPVKVCVRESPVVK
jgi:hypothetical protein